MGEQKLSVFIPKKCACPVYAHFLSGISALLHTTGTDSHAAGANGRTERLLPAFPPAADKEIKLAQDPDGGTPKKVQVYDRPASADRPSPIIFVILAFVVLAVLYFLARHFHWLGIGLQH